MYSSFSTFPGKTSIVLSRESPEYKHSHHPTESLQVEEEKKFRDEKRKRKNGFWDDILRNKIGQQSAISR